ncbi:MAG TPA: VOC family protein [Terracidiphilus sp.]|jgi:hypothetical protein
MAAPAQHHTINYLELSAPDIAKAKEFYSTVFGWKFQDWGPEYIAFDKAGAGIDGGFRLRDAAEPSTAAGPLIVLYSSNLAATEATIQTAGGSIVVPTFEFPGGRRFHFADPAGNVLAVWSE